MNQGGGRKGLPASFLNRFTKVYLDALETDDLQSICGALFPRIPSPTLHQMIAFNQAVHHSTMVERSIGRAGHPWEFNLRDIFRWCQLMQHPDQAPLHALSATSAASAPLSTSDKSGLAEFMTAPGAHVDLAYMQRMRTRADREHMANLFRSVFGADSKSGVSFALSIVRCSERLSDL
jgi:midasin